MSGKTVFYDPTKTFEDNIENGPFPDSVTMPLNQTTPGFKVLGFDVNSPFGIPAGPLPTSKHTGLAFELGFDVVCYKTQRTTEFKPNQFPHVVSLDVDGDLTLEKASGEIVGSTDFGNDYRNLTITNSFGNPSLGPDFWQDDLKKAVAGAGNGQLLIMSVVGTIKEGFSDEDYFDDFAEAASTAVKAGAKAIELNLSCPNVASEGVLCYSPDSVEAICQKVRAKVGNDIPVVAKIGYFSSEQQPLLEDVVGRISGMVQAISAINTIPAAVVDEKGKQFLPGEGRLKSGSCGAGIKWAGLDLVKRLDELRKSKDYDFEIFGVGGVMSAEDFLEYRQAGADCVQSATGAMWNPALAREIRDVL